MKSKRGTFVLLNVAFLIYSLSSVMSKAASRQEVLSWRWILCYGAMLCAMGVYAVMWQLALKNMDLILAYSNKAVVVIWGLVWGMLLFHEQLSVLKLIGVAVIVLGILILSKDEKHD